ncbi:MAG: hypothetical protein R3Y13_05875, partial [bacterium]
MENDLQIKELLSEIESWIELSNKIFATKCIRLLFSLNVTDSEIKVLEDLHILNMLLGKKSRYSFPILREVSSIRPSRTDLEVNGYGRYYSETYKHSDKYYIICNDWYYNNKIG